MSIVYIGVRKDGKTHWQEISEGIVACLEDPLRQGVYYMPKKSLDSITKKDFPDFLFQDSRFVHFASNLGFSIDYSCTSRIMSPDRREALTIIQLSDKVAVDQIKLGNPRSSFLTPNLSKIMSGGSPFIFDGTYEEVKAEMEARKYTFTEPEEGEFQTAWYTRVVVEVREQRKRLITDEFAQRASEQFFGSPKTKEELIALLTNVDLTSR